MKILYLDLFAAINLLADYLICLSTGRICAGKLRRRRYLAAAVFGAAYAVLTLAPGFAFLAGPFYKLAAAFAMSGIAFGAEANPIRCALTMLAIATVFGGFFYASLPAMAGTSVLSLRKLLAVFLFCCGLLKLLSRGRCRWDGVRKAEVKLVFRGREATFAALVDSGNSLRCPSTGEDALIVSPLALRPIFLDRTVLLEELSPVDLVEVLSHFPEYAGRLRLIPFRSLGGNGLMPVFHPEKLWIDGRENNDLLVAISREARGNGFEAIL